MGTLLLLLAPSAFAFAVLLCMARYERWVEADGSWNPD